MGFKATRVWILLVPIHRSSASDTPRCSSVITYKQKRRNGYYITQNTHIFGDQFILLNTFYTHSVLQHLRVDFSVNGVDFSVDDVLVTSLSTTSTRFFRCISLIRWSISFWYDLGVEYVVERWESGVSLFGMEYTIIPSPFHAKNKKNRPRLTPYDK
jgi:hypothetical protein